MEMGRFDLFGTQNSGFYLSSFLMFLCDKLIMCCGHSICAAWIEFGTAKNGCWWFAHQAC